MRTMFHSLCATFKAAFFALPGVVAFLIAALGLAVVYMEELQIWLKDRPRIRWTMALVLIVIGVCAFVADITQKAQERRERDKAINDTAATVATETSRRVTEAMSKQYKDTIADLNQEIGSLRQELFAQGKNVVALKSATQQQLALDFIPSLDVFWQNNALNFTNRGKTNLYMWGNKIDDGQRDMIANPMLLTPQGSYHILTDKLEREIHEKLPPNAEDRVPLEVYVSETNRKRHTLKYLLWIKVKAGVIAIETQNQGIIEGNF